MHTCLLLTLLPYALALPGSSPSPSPSPSSSSSTPNTPLQSTWGNLSPYTNAPPFNSTPKGVPRGCALSQVHILHRHAQRYPTDSPLDGELIDAFARKIQNFKHNNKNSTSSFGGQLAFLDTWEYLLGKEALLPSGAATEATSGAEAWARYGQLLYGEQFYSGKTSNGTRRAKPVFRTTDKARVLESARWWLSGFFSNVDAKSSQDQYDLVITPEGDGFNNTLASSSCDGDLKEGDKSSIAFAPTFLSTPHHRLQSSLPRSLHLSTNDTLAMMTLCPYETAALGSSSFCALFTPSEWASFAYNLDLQFDGNHGFGAPTGKAQGIGYVTELEARLKSHLITVSDSSVNTTVDGHPDTFPVGDRQPLYMDMSHDDQVVAVLAALGAEYFNYNDNGKGGLPDARTKESKEAAEQAVRDRTFRLNQITPFGAHLVSEVWECPASSSFGMDSTLYKNPDLAGKQTEKYIRFVLNGAPVPLGGVPGCVAGERKEALKKGFCPLEGFLGGVGEMKEKAQYQSVCT